MDFILCLSGNFHLLKGSLIETVFCVEFSSEIDCPRVENEPSSRLFKINLII